MQNKNSLIDLIINNIKIFIIVLIISTIFSVTISFILPVWYKSTSTILITQSTPTGNILQSVTGNVPLGSLGSGLTKNKIQRYISILKSRTVINEVVEKFNLMERYQAESKEAAIENFRDNSYQIETEEGALEVAVFDKKREIVDNMVNFYIKKLDSVNSLLSSKDARFQKNFYKERISIIKSELSTLQDSLVEFQKKHEILDPEIQAKNIIGTIAELKKEKIIKEVKYNLYKKIFSEKNPKISRIKYELEGLEQKMQDIKYNINKNEKEFFHSINSLPRLTKRYMNLKMNVEIKTKVIEYLVPRYEQARVKHAKDIPTLQILDKGYTPENKAKPKRKLIVVGFVFASLFFTLLTLIYQKND